MLISSICANTLFAVMILASPYLSLILEAITGLKKSIIVSIPFLIASVAIALAGSIPKTSYPNLLKAFRIVPSFEPISITKPLLWKLSHRYLAYFSKCGIDVSFRC